MSVTTFEQIRIMNISLLRLMCVIHVLAVRGSDNMDGQQRYHAWSSNGQGDSFLQLIEFQNHHKPTLD